MRAPTVWVQTVTLDVLNVAIMTLKNCNSGIGICWSSKMNPNGPLLYWSEIGYFGFFFVLFFIIQLFHYKENCFSDFHLKSIDCEPGSGGTHI